MARRFSTPGSSMRRLPNKSPRLQPPNRIESFVMILAALGLHPRAWFAVALVLAVAAMVALAPSNRWQALARPQFITDIEAALPPADQLAEVRAARAASVS